MKVIGGACKCITRKLGRRGSARVLRPYYPLRTDDRLDEPSRMQVDVLNLIFYRIGLDDASDVPFSAGSFLLPAVPRNDHLLLNMSWGGTWYRYHVPRTNTTAPKKNGGRRESDAVEVERHTVYSYSVHTGSVPVPVCWLNNQMWRPVFHPGYHIPVIRLLIRLVIRPRKDEWLWIMDTVPVAVPLDTL